MYRFFLFTFLALLLIIEGAVVKKNNVNSEQKLEQITDLASKSKGNVITLDDATYAYYAVSKPCPYALVVFMTASHPKFKCGICKQLDKEFHLLAESYAESIKDSKQIPNTFFVRLDYESAQKVYQNYQITSVPVIFHVAPRLTDKNSNDYQISARDRYQMPTDPDAESLANFLRDRTNYRVTIKRSAVGVYISLVIVFVILSALVQPVISALPTLLKIVQFKPLWMIVCACIYTCAISGVIFDIIRSPPMYYANPQTGQIMFFYPQSGSQFVVEGFIIGFLNLACSGAVIYLGVVAPKMKTTEGRSTAVTVCIIVFLICFFQIRNLYRMKNRWYGQVM